METATHTTGIDSLLEAYEALKKERPGMLAAEQGGELSWLRKARERDASRWRKLGFPRKSQERWKYSRLSALAGERFALAGRESSALPSRELFPKFAGAAAEITFLNGKFVPEWSSLPQDRAEVSILVLSKLFEDCVAGGWTAERKAALEKFREHVESSDADLETTFASMNTSLLQDGVLIQLSPLASVDTPIVLSSFYDGVPNGASPWPLVSPRAFVHLGRGSRAALIECYAGSAGARYFTNAVSDIRLDDGAHLSHARVQLESAGAVHAATTRIHQRRDSFCESFQFTLGAAVSRQDLHFSLEKNGATAFLDGLYMVDGTRHCDHSTRVDHLSPNTTSEQVYKGILDGSAHAAFTGHVRIVQDAQKSSAAQLNNNLLMSPKAEIDTRPQLEIDADDVKAAHGATIGRIDPEQVFYLETRAFSPAEATRALALGFAQDIPFRIRHEKLRELMTGLVGERFMAFRAGATRG